MPAAYWCGFSNVARSAIVGRVEDDDVGEHALAEEAAAVELEVRGRQAGQPADRLLERDHLLVAHVLAEQPREVAVGARVRGRTS